MIITIQPLKKGYAISLVDTFSFPNMNQYEISREADKISDLASSSKTKPRPVIKWLPMERTPVIKVDPRFTESVDAIINSNQPMATKKTYPAKKKAVVKKVVKKGKKK